MTATAPPYLSGHFTPVADETTAEGLWVDGTLPPELDGYYIRNGHNPLPGVTPSHWFQGSGMLHGVRLRDGMAEWYRNRWVRTPALGGAPLFRDDGSMDLTASVAGTHIIEHGGRLLALQEANLPFEVTPDLDTVGPFDFGGTLTTSMTAHTKEDPDTGELLFYSYSPFPPYLTYYVASPEGRITSSTVVEGAGPSMMHDFAVTSTKAIFLAGPVVFDPAERSGIPYRWHHDRGARIGVMDRSGDGGITWIPVEPGVLLHVTNAYDLPDGRVVLEGPRYDRAGWETSWKWWANVPGYPDVPVTGAVAHRYVLDPVAGTAGEERLDDLVTDFPTIDGARSGRPTDISYAVAFPGAGLDRFAIAKVNTATGQRDLYDAGPDRHAGEAFFVPVEGGTSEDDGYLLSIVSDLRADASQLLVLDARDLTTRATVHLPRRVPSGIHGSFVPAADLI